MTKTHRLRIVVVALVALIVVGGVFGTLRYGGLCSLDLYIATVTDPWGPLLMALEIWRLPISVTCPLGYVERSLASRELLPQWPSVLLVLLSVIVLGRIFCAWVCPTVLFRRLTKGNPGLQPKREAAPAGTNWTAYSPYAVLGGALAASFVFQFPVFCFFCPIGLFFGALFAVTKAFTTETLGLELLLFPAMLGLEMVFLKSWCRSICPMGALLSLFGNLNRFLVPTVDKDKCLGEKGVNCQACKRACPEGIDLTKIKTSYSPNSCTKCLECYVKCPMKGIKFPVLSRAQKTRPVPSEKAPVETGVS